MTHVMYIVREKFRLEVECYDCKWEGYECDLEIIVLPDGKILERCPSCGSERWEVKDSEYNDEERKTWAKGPLITQY